VHKIAIVFVAAALLSGCNPTDAKDMSQDGGKFAETAIRSAANASVAAKVTTMLGLHEDVNILDLKVEAEGDTVTISGRVKTKKERDLIIGLANKTRGVGKVIDKLEVKP
jgi:osmotically-inducible protein OsmY